MLASPSPRVRGEVEVAERPRVRGPLRDSERSVGATALQLRPEATARRRGPLVTCESLRGLRYPVRWRARDRRPRGTSSPWMSLGLCPPFHRTRTVAWAACEARLRKEGIRWTPSQSASTLPRIGWIFAFARAAKVLSLIAVAPGSRLWLNG